MKKPLIYLMSAALVLSLFSEANIVNAETVGEDGSEASVQFVLPEDAVAPVDPRDPSELYPGDAGEDGTVTEQAGPLTLDYASNINFGESDISTSSETYASETASPFVQVSDRRATGEGWLLTAELSSFNGTLEEEDGTITDLGETLPGATITFANGNADSTSTTPKPEVNSGIVLSSGGDDANVANADGREEGAELSTAEGLGTWVITWLTGEPEAPKNENVILTVPEAAATEGNHTATINWTLTDDPLGESINTPIEEDVSE